MGEKPVRVAAESSKGRGPAAGTSGLRSGSKQFGESGERLAAGWLAENGYHLLARNWRSALGEIDIVCERSGELVFVEVKARHSIRLGAPEEAVTPAKRHRLIRAAQSYLLKHGEEQRPYRIDVLAVYVAPSGRLLDIRHYPGCIESEG